MAVETRRLLRASERQRASGHKRPAWPGNAMMAVEPVGRGERPERQRSERPPAAGVAGDRNDGLRGRGTL
jgi:hypothetical protein